MSVNNSEKFISEFSIDERTHLTIDTHIKNNDKRKVALLLGELLSPRLSCFTVHTRISSQTFGPKLASRLLSLAETDHPNTLFSCYESHTIMSVRKEYSGCDSPIF